MQHLCVSPGLSANPEFYITGPQDLWGGKLCSALLWEWERVSSFTDPLSDGWGEHGDSSPCPELLDCAARQPGPAPAVPVLLGSP